MTFYVRSRQGHTIRRDLFLWLAWPLSVSTTSWKEQIESSKSSYEEGIVGMAEDCKSENKLRVVVVVVVVVRSSNRYCSEKEEKKRKKLFFQKLFAFCLGSIDG